jgi:hypothetical protein
VGVAPGEAGVAVGGTVIGVGVGADPVLLSMAKPDKSTVVAAPGIEIPAEYEPLAVGTNNTDKLQLAEACKTSGHVRLLITN